MSGPALSPLEREEIRAFLVDDPSVGFASIAIVLGRDPSTITREVGRMEGVSGIGRLVHNSEPITKASLLARTC